MVQRHQLAPDQQERENYNYGVKFSDAIWLCVFDIHSNSVLYVSITQIIFSLLMNNYNKPMNLITITF